MFPGWLPPAGSKPILKWSEDQSPYVGITFNRKEYFLWRSV